MLDTDDMGLGGALTRPHDFSLILWIDVDVARIKVL
jgi:hypothetical protein